MTSPIDKQQWTQADVERGWADLYADGHSHGTSGAPQSTVQSEIPKGFTAEQYEALGKVDAARSARVTSNESGIQDGKTNNTAPKVIADPKPLQPRSLEHAGPQQPLRHVSDLKQRRVAGETAYFVADGDKLGARHHQDRVLKDRGYSHLARGYEHPTAVHEKVAGRVFENGEVHRLAKPGGKWGYYVNVSEQGAAAEWHQIAHNQVGKATWAQWAKGGGHAAYQGAGVAAEGAGMVFKGGTRVVGTAARGAGVLALLGIGGAMLAGAAAER